MKKTLTLKALAVSAVISLAAATAWQASAAADQKDFVIMKVNGKEIKNSDVKEVWSNIFPGNEKPEIESFDPSIKENVLRGMASEMLLYKEATEKGFDKREDIKKRLEAIEKQIVIQSFIEETTKEAVSKTKLQKLYDEKIRDTSGREEVHARHILVSDEAKAKEIYKKIKDGGDFAEIAKKESEDKGSGAIGGDLGFFTADRMVPQFADAAFLLKKPGDISEPVKTDFGWHIIKLEERRKMPTPTFDELLPQMREELTGKSMQEYITGLMKKADIKYYDEQGKEKPFPVEPKPMAAPEVAPAAGEQGKAPAAGQTDAVGKPDAGGNVAPTPVQ